MCFIFSYKLSAISYSEAFLDFLIRLSDSIIASAKTKSSGWVILIFRELPSTKAISIPSFSTKETLMVTFVQFAARQRSIQNYHTERPAVNARRNRDRSTVRTIRPPSIVLIVSVTGATRQAAPSFAAISTVRFIFHQAKPSAWPHRELRRSPNPGRLPQNRFAPIRPGSYHRRRLFLALLFGLSYLSMQ